MKKAILQYGLEISKEDISLQELSAIRNNLTFKIENDYTHTTEIVYGYQEKENSIIIPRKYSSYFSKNGFNIEDIRSEGRELNLQDNGFIPRENQIEFIEKTTFPLLSGENSYGVMPCGGGKTVCAIETIKRVNRSACVIVHKDFLKNQWKERIKEFFPLAKVGECQQDICNTGNDYDIVIAMVQSLTRREYPKSFYDSFGLVILDESHRYSSKLWSEALFKFSAKRFFCLSATPNRRDGMEKLLHLQVCKPTYEVKSQPIIPIIYVREIDTYIPEKSYKWGEKLNYSKLINQICKNKERNDGIINDILSAEKSERKVFVITDRLTHIDYLISEVKKIKPECSIGKYVGGTKQEILDIEAEKRVIFGTYSMASEALDIPDLDLLIIASPRSDMVQAVGRILRQVEGKKRPVVIDRLDNIQILEYMFNKRFNQYIERGYEVKSLKG